jgi:hypothetical protein
LRSDTEDYVDELPLRYRIALRDPPDLTFADCMHRFVPLDGSTRTFSRSESEARGNPLLYESMALLEDVIQVARGSAATAPAEFTGLLQFGNRAGVGRMPVHIDYPRPWSATG